MSANKETGNLPVPLLVKNLFFTARTAAAQTVSPLDSGAKARYRRNGRCCAKTPLQAQTLAWLFRAQVAAPPAPICSLLSTVPSHALVEGQPATFLSKFLHRSGGFSGRLELGKTFPTRNLCSVFKPDS